MPPAPEELAARARFWRSAARYRSLSTLFREEGNGPLQAVARTIEAHLSRTETLMATNEELVDRTKVLLAEIETLLMRARSARAEARALVRAPVYNADDVREEARLCTEEARATEHAGSKRSLAGGALSLAQLAEAMERDRRS